MKLDNLLFEADIKFENGKILTAILDFIKANNITEQDCKEALAIVKRSQEFKEILALGFTDSSGPVQMKRATFEFSPNKYSPNYENLSGGRYVFTCFPTGLVRAAVLGQSKPMELKVEEPTQISKGVSAAEAMAENLKMTIKTAINKVHTAINKKTNAANRHASDKAKFEALGLPEGLEIRVGSGKYNFIKKNKDGTFSIKLNGSESLVIKMPELTELPIQISEIKSNESVSIHLDAPKLKNFSGFPKAIDELWILGPDQVPLVASYFTSLTRLYLNSAKQYDLNTPLMSLTKIKGLKHFRYYSSFLNDDEKAVLSAIEDYLNGRKDELDLQDAFLDVGYDKAAKF